MGPRVPRAMQNYLLCQLSPFLPLLLQAVCLLSPTAGTCYPWDLWRLLSTALTSPAWPRPPLCRPQSNCHRGHVCQGAPCSADQRLPDWGLPGRGPGAWGPGAWGPGGLGGRLEPGWRKVLSESTSAVFIRMRRPSRPDTPSMLVLKPLCQRVCVRICVCVCLCVCVYVSVFISMYLSLCLSVCVFVCLCICVCV